MNKFLLASMISLFKKTNMQIIGIVWKIFLDLSCSALLLRGGGGERLSNMHNEIIVRLFFYPLAGSQPILKHNVPFLSYFFYPQRFMSTLLAVCGRPA